MYRLSDSQIDFIFNDILARGVEMEDLQDNLLDHVCCIIEQDLEENGDFESFYQKTIATFYKEALWEIEEETLLLLTFKNYYVMKKIMINSGIFSAITMVLGIWFKFMHWPGASLLLPLGILVGSLIFMPLIFTLRAKEQQNKKDKFVTIAGALSASLICLSIVFRIMLWPLSMYMLFISTGIMVVFFLPLFLVNGIRNPATKTNTIVSALLIIMGYTLLLSLVRTPRSERVYKTVFTSDYLRNEHILANANLQMKNLLKNDSSNLTGPNLNQKINVLCEELKSMIIEKQTGHKSIKEDFESENILLTDNYVDADFDIHHKLNEIKQLVIKYNSTIKTGMNKIPTKASFMQEEPFECERVTILLNEIFQLQLILVQNQGEFLASK